MQMCRWAVFKDVNNEMGEKKKLDDYNENQKSVKCVMDFSLWCLK